MHQLYTQTHMLIWILIHPYECHMEEMTLKCYSLSVEVGFGARYEQGDNCGLNRGVKWGSVRMKSIKEIPTNVLDWSTMLSIM